MNSKASHQMLPRELTLSAFLASASTGRIGSLGEFVFQKWAEGLGKSVIPVHDLRTDFLVDGGSYDVKAYSKYYRSGRTPAKPTRYSGKRYPGISYAVVDFHGGGAVLSEEGTISASLAFEDLERLFLEWALRRPRRRLQDAPARDLTEWKSIEQEVRTAFTSAGLSTPVLLRRSVDFGPKESPHNLAPSARPARLRTGVTVYVHFRSSPPSRELIERIYAFPDFAEARFTIAPSSLADDMRKIDLRSIPDEFVFRSLGDLLTSVSSGIFSPDSTSEQPGR